MVAKFGDILRENRCGPELGPDQRVRRGGHFWRSEIGARSADHQDGLIIMAQNVKWLKMVIYN